MGGIGESLLTTQLHEKKKISTFNSLRRQKEKGKGDLLFPEKSRGLF